VEQVEPEQTESEQTESQPESAANNYTTQKKRPYSPRRLPKVTLLTVEKYLERTTHEPEAALLIRSLFRTKLMRFEEWEVAVYNLLKKKVK
jgi:hypothetical protein